MTREARWEGLLRPRLPTSKMALAWWQPERHGPSIHARAHEEPLPTPEMARSCHQDDALIEPIGLNAEPTLTKLAHVCADNAVGRLAEPIRPPDAGPLSPPDLVELRLAGQGC
jgi:hypothetical protein